MVGVEAPIRTMVRIFARWDVGLTPHAVSRVDGRKTSRVADDQGDAGIIVDTMNARGEVAGEAGHLC